jgi:hypothetical protein
MRSLRLFSLAAVAAIVLTSGSAIHATTISAGTPDPVSNPGTAPGSASNYDFGDFGQNGQPIKLTDFTVSTAGDMQYPGVGQQIPYTTLTAPDGSGPFQTGIAYSGNFSPSTAVIATFSPDSAGSFTVWILDGNTDGNGVGNATVGLGVNGGAEVVTNTVYDLTNEFTEYTVTGALSTDVFQVYATTNISNSPSLGGITFSDINSSTSTVPEPSSLVLLGTGVLGSLGVVRRKLFKA